MHICACAKITTWVAACTKGLVHTKSGVEGIERRGVKCLKEKKMRNYSVTHVKLARTNTHTAILIGLAYIAI